MKKKIFFIIMPIVLFACLVIFRSTVQKTEGEISPATNKAVTVRVQNAAESKSITRNNEYPAVVNADQEATITAKTSGTVTAVNFDLGKYVSAGSLLARIDDTGTNLGLGENSFKSAQIQQLEIAVRQAKENLSLAKKNKDDDSTSATKSAKDIAKLQLENAEISLQSALEAHNATAPISGSVVSKSVSVGDSVVVGQTLAVISNSSKTKVSFFVEQEKAGAFKSGDEVSIVSSDNSFSNAIILNIAPQADPLTKRFRIDAQPMQQLSLQPGTILSIRTQQTENVTGNGNLLLPISAMTIAQNENYIFIIENGLAKKINFEIIRIFGENAEIKAQVTTDAQIVIEGNKLLKDGSKVEVD
jgi:RND family efflux transporter MFP subunit